MAMTRADWGGLALAAVIAVAAPALLLRSAADEAVVVPAPLVLPPAAPDLARAYARPLFGGAASAPLADTPADAPELAGIVGRIGRDAVAMVRGADGRTRTLDVGESVDGWTLESLAIDAAFFTRGGQRARVALPVGDRVWRLALPWAKPTSSDAAVAAPAGRARARLCLRSGAVAVPPAPRALSKSHRSPASAWASAG